MESEYIIHSFKSELFFVDMYAYVNNNYYCEDRKVQHKRLET